MSEVGGILRGARQRRGLSLSQAAEATRIKIRFLDALENGEFSALPGPAYITGFLRNYAGYLGLHPDDVLEEYYAARPVPQPSVKAATRVLASGYDRQHRTRLMWVLAVVVMLLVGGYIVKQYSEAKAYAPPLNVTPANLNGTVIHPGPRYVQPVIQVGLRAVTSTWVQVTVDGVRRFRGILALNHAKSWQGHKLISVVTWEGPRIQATYDGKPQGPLARQPGLSVQVATASGWQQAS